MSDALFARLFERAQAESHGAGQGVELFERRGRSLELSRDEEGTRAVDADERAFALRLFRGGRVAFAAGTAADAPHLLPRAQALLPRARARRGVKVPAPPSEGAEPPEREAPAPDAAAADKLLDAFGAALAAAGGGAVQLREAVVAHGARLERIATSAGRDVSFSSRAASLVATVVGRTSAGRQTARVVASAGRLTDLAVTRLARQAADRVLLPLSGRPFEGGRVDLILDAHVAAQVVARLVPLFFADQEEALLAARTRGGRDPFAAPALTLVDDALVPGGPVRSVRDGEGTPHRRTLLVDRGHLAGRLTDVAAAARLGTEPTGHAVRLAWSEPPRVGPTNVFFDPAAGVSALSLLSGVTRGLYAAALLERPRVDAAADHFRLAVCGYLVERGRAAQRISEAVVDGRLSELLRGVEAVGDDLRFAAGAGGGVGSPTLFVPRWRLR